MILPGSGAIIPACAVAHVRKYVWEWGLWLVPFNRVFLTALTRVLLLNLLNDPKALPHLFPV